MTQPYIRTEQPKLVASFGGGVNSAAMLVGMWERGIIPDAILFADTGGEKPETYEFLGLMHGWCEEHLSRAIYVVAHHTDTLRNSCFRNGTLPSKAYGFSGCSVKFKHQLMERWESQTYGKETVITKAIGYHSEETKRSDVEEKGRYRYRYFLREWGWDQQDCLEAIRRAGLPVPIKSACYYCPSSKKHEVLWLARVHPDLFADAVAMERNAEAYHKAGGGSTKGLGRTWSWEKLVQISDAQMTLLPEAPQIACMCFDGDV